MQDEGLPRPEDSPLPVLSRTWNKLKLHRHRRGFHSRFGGLWTDRLDAPELLVARVARGELDARDGDALAAWMREGYWIQPEAVPLDAVERLKADIAALWAAREPAVRVELDGRTLALAPELALQHPKLVDVYVRSQAALELALAAPIRRFLALVFDEAPLLFQSLSFERGSEQPLHQDTAYVVVVPPMAMVAAWIALEDVQEGSGELVYYPGSHRLPEQLFHGARNWNREHDGLEAQQQYQQGLVRACDAAGLERRLFRPRKGDVLFWNADLAHGGSAILDPTLTRRSLVCHYCPASAKPYYFAYRPDRRTRVPFAGASYASSHYALQFWLPPGAGRLEPIQRQIAAQSPT